MKPEGSLLCSQEFFAGPYPEPHEAGGLYSGKNRVEVLLNENDVSEESLNI
jgi:hypothetical protein